MRAAGGIIQVAYSSKDLKLLFAIAATVFVNWHLNTLKFLGSQLGIISPPVAAVKVRGARDGGLMRPRSLAW